MRRHIVHAIITMTVVGGLAAWTPSGATEHSESSGFGIGARYTYAQNVDTEESANMGGVFLRLRGRFIGLEGAIDYREEELGDDDLEIGVKVKSWPVSASLLVYPLPILYGVAGLAWYNTTFDVPETFPFEDETDTPLGYHFGGGVELPVSSTVRLTSDVRWLFVDYDLEDIPESIGEVDADSFSVNAGLLFFFE